MASAIVKVPSSSKEDKINGLFFNQDKGRFVCCMESGLRIYNVEPLAEEAHYIHKDMGSVAVAELLWRSNVVALVGGGATPKFADNTVLIYDDRTKKFIVEINCVETIKAVKLRKDRLIVATLKQLHVYAFPSFHRLMTHDTGNNPNGLLEITPLTLAAKYVVAFPGERSGSLALLDINNKNKLVSSVPTIIPAHSDELVSIAMSSDGTKVATACICGTIIRVWDTIKHTQLIELRRGSKTATIYSMSFSRTVEFLCVSSDTGTVHIFAIKDDSLNKKYSINSLMNLGQYFASKYSFAQFTIPPESACVCAFSGDNSVVAICFDGSFYKYSFTTTGDCSRQEFSKFLDHCLCITD